MYTYVYPTGFSFEWVAEKSTFRDAHGLTHLLHMLHVFNDADSGGLQMGIAHVLRNVFGPVYLCICVWPGIYMCIYVCCRWASLMFFVMCLARCVCACARARVLCVCACVCVCICVSGSGSGPGSLTHTNTHTV